MSPSPRPQAVARKRTASPTTTSRFSYKSACQLAFYADPALLRYAWFLTFSPEGKIVEIHEYLNTALLERVFAANKA